MQTSRHVLRNVSKKSITVKRNLSTFQTSPVFPGFISYRHSPCAQSYPVNNIRSFASSKCLSQDALPSKAKDNNRRNGSDQQNKDEKLVHDGRLDEKIGEKKELQQRTPWHREGADQPPVKRERSAGAMTKGKLLTTPSRLLKLILPLTTIDKNSDRKDIEPLALLVHPQQPLSYLERLIQSELPMIDNGKGDEKVPSVYFRAEDSSQDVEVAKKTDADEDDEVKRGSSEEGTEEHMVDGKLVKTGKISKGTREEFKEGLKDVNVAENLRGGPGEGGVETYSGLGRESSQDRPQKFVRWSSSTEIGDFIRDAARGREFAVEIEGAKKDIRVGVPSFNDRTHYLRVRLRKTSKRLAGMADLKKECDDLAHKSAQRLAMGGFGILIVWWICIYHFTFQTEYGWDTMEPITYLAGLSTIMVGYLYFLYHNRDVSYRAALHLTVSHRQNQLYNAKGFDLQRWESLIEEANALRKEIKMVANEYDVEWDEKADEGSEAVHEALREERKKAERKKKESDDDDDDDNGSSSKGKERAKKVD